MVRVIDLMTMMVIPIVVTPVEIVIEVSPDTWNAQSPSVRIRISINSNVYS